MDRLVYSTRSGKVCPGCGQPVATCACARTKPIPEGDGIVRVRREVKGRGGKTVTAIMGLALAPDALADLGAELKRRCGTGGTVKDGVILIQGDHVDLLIAELEKRGYRVKRAGG
jgi:translation initiation factor 1